MSAERSQSKNLDKGGDNRFESVMRGYDKHQVDGYVAWMQDQIAAAQAGLGDARRELEAARGESERLRQQLQTRPQHEQVSERMAQILRLAQEEAEQEREKAAQLAAGILEGAEAQARDVIEKARSDAAEMTRETQRSCEEQITDARAKAAELVETARQQSEATLAEARERPRRVLSDVDRRSRQIMALQQRRLAAVLAAHEDAMNRLEIAGRLINEQLEQDHEEGDPAAQVDPQVLPTLGPAIEAGELDSPSGSQSSQPPGETPDDGDGTEAEGSASPDVDTAPEGESGAPMARTSA
jgi:cell division septum initiation protein DivIVA